MTDARAGGTRQARGGRLVLAALVVVIAGLVGMHGLGSHGAGLADHMIGSAHGSSGMTATRAVMNAMPLADLDTNELVPVALPGIGGGQSSFADLCLAVLSLVGFVVILAVSRRGTLRRAQMCSSRRVGLIRPHMSGPDPPSLAELSLLRC